MSHIFCWTQINTVLSDAVTAKSELRVQPLSLCLWAEVGCGNVRGVVVCTCGRDVSRCSLCTTYVCDHRHHGTVPLHWLQIIWTTAWQCQSALAVQRIICVCCHCYCFAVLLLVAARYFLHLHQIPHLFCIFVVAIVVLCICVSYR